MQLDFENLFKQALTEWPDELDLSVLERSASDLSRYAVKGFGVLSDEIESKYIGTKTEAITRTLHYAISEVIHTAAKTILKVEPSAIRPQAVRLIFEKRLKEAAVASDLNWRSEDYALAEAYFAQNASA
jgi:hypothetical protein